MTEHVLDAVADGSSNTGGIALPAVSRTQQDVRFASKVLTPILNETETETNLPFHPAVTSLGEPSSASGYPPSVESNALNTKSSLGFNTLLSTSAHQANSSAPSGM
jgi:hypothetical protein